jgi:hypothetical protein
MFGFQIFGFEFWILDFENVRTSHRNVHVLFGHRDYLKGQDLTEPICSH